MPTAEQIPPGKKSDKDFSLYVNYGFDRNLQRKIITVVDGCTFPESLAQNGLIDLSPDGSHAWVKEETRILSFPQEVTPDLKHLSEGQFIGMLCRGETIEISRFIMPKDPTDEESLRSITHKFQSSIAHVETFTFDGHSAAIALGPGNALFGPAVRSKLPTTGDTELLFTDGHHEFTLIFDRQGSLLKAALKGGADRIPLHRYVAVSDGNGIPWIGEDTEQDAPEHASYLLVFDAAKTSDQAALVRLKDQNPLYLADAVDHKPRMTEILQMLTEKEWQFGGKNHDLHIARLSHTSEVLLPVYVVYQANIEHNDRRATDVCTSLAHTIHMRKDWSGLDLESPNLNGFIHLFSPVDIQLEIGTAIQVDLRGNRVTQANVSLSDIGKHVDHRPDRGKQLIGIYLFPDQPILTPNGTEVRAVMVTNTPTWMEKLKNRK